MEKAYAFVIISVIIFCFYSCYQLYHYRSDKKLKKLVAWCVTDDSSKFRGNLKLHHYVKNAQLQNISPEYRISGETEWEYVQEILCAYTKNLTEQYFDNGLYVPKSKYVVRGEDYFMFSLCNYLKNHECDYDFCGHPMHEKTLSFENHGMWGGMLYDAKFALSDFAIAFHKLHYVAYMFCKTSPIINPSGGSYRFDDDFRKILDTKQIEISRI